MMTSSFHMNVQRSKVLARHEGLSRCYPRQAKIDRGTHDKIAKISSKTLVLVLKYIDATTRAILLQ